MTDRNDGRCHGLRPPLNPEGVGVVAAEQSIKIQNVDGAWWTRLGEWVHARGMGSLPPRDYYPPTGLVADECVAGFLAKTDGRAAYITSIVSDPHSTPARRRAALRALIDALVTEARRAGFLAVFSSPSVGTLVDRFTECGFRKVRPCTFVIWEG